MPRRLLVSGVVQGVGFRYFVCRRALSLSLRGWVRNLPDGRVEVVADGPPEKVSALEEAISQGPSHAQVKKVEKSDISDEVIGSKTFEIR
jgi:acylphosphatase